jgi:hypothetical protein
MPALPPDTTGHPTVWAAAVSSRATPAVAGDDSGRTACAPAPASSARAGSSPNRDTSRSRLRTPSRPNRAARSGLRGMRRSGDSTASARAPASSTNGPSRRR